MGKDKEYLWLNKPSHDFLEQDYLEKGQSVDDRITIIGDTAEKILNKPGFSKNLFGRFRA